MGLTHVLYDSDRDSSSFFILIVQYELNKTSPIDKTISLPSTASIFCLRYSDLFWVKNASINNVLKKRDRFVLTG